MLDLSNPTQCLLMGKIPFKLMITLVHTQCIIGIKMLPLTQIRAGNKVRSVLQLFYPQYILANTPFHGVFCDTIYLMIVTVTKAS